MGSGDTRKPCRNERLRALPPVDRVMAELAGEDAAPLVAEAARFAVDAARRGIVEGGAAGDETESFERVVAGARRRLREGQGSLLRPVINGTGVLIHTNLGRVPLGPEQLNAVTRVASGYSNLEYDIAAGMRGSRYAHASRLINALTGAPASLVVNNNAAAVLLVLAALCRDRQVIISRGELIEIGGEFRIPDVMAASGAQLVEVGTTNRTHLADYERAMSSDTAAILRVHPSNYRVVGFTSSVATRDLARLAKGRGVPLFFDIGSGLVGGDAHWAHTDPAADAALGDGADIVTFSGDKLLGGPQAGIIAGRVELVARLARHPLLRALRVDKMTLAALEATAAAHLSGRRNELPAWRMATTPIEELAARAEKLVARLKPDLDSTGFKIEAIAARSVAGGGAVPGADIGSVALTLSDPQRGAAGLAAALRALETPVISRIEDERVVIDLRTVLPGQDAALGAGLLAVAKSPPA